MLRAHHVYYSTDNVIIPTPDTDVLIIAIAISTEIPGNLFIRFGTKSNAHIKSVKKVKQSLMLCYELQDAELISKSLFRSQKSEVLSKLLSKALMDVTPIIVSTFCGKGKLKP